MRLGNLEIQGDLVLAPMAGVTGLAFRTICAELGAAVTVTEMVSSRALIYQDKKSRRLLHLKRKNAANARKLPGSLTALPASLLQRPLLLAAPCWACCM